MTSPDLATDLADDVRALERADAALLAASPSPFPLPLGALAPVVAGTVRALDASDWWVPGLRERVGAVLRGASVDDLRDAFLGAPDQRVAPPGGSPALRALNAVGLAWATEAPVVVHLGIGSFADGAIHEALNLLGLRGGAVTVVATVVPLRGAPVPEQVAISPSALGASFGLDTAVVDGTSAEDIYAAVRTARDSGSPWIIEVNWPAQADK